MLLQNGDECFFRFMQQFLLGNKELIKFGMKQWFVSQSLPK